MSNDVKKVHTHYDCAWYVAIDVFKGYCNAHKEIRYADTESCKQFHPVAKCKYCQHYTPDDDFLATCKGTAPVYPDLLAKTCKEFQRIHE